MTNLRRVTLAAAAACLFALPVSAAISLASGPSAQTFDSLGIPATSSTVSTLPANFRVDNPAVVRTVGSFGAASATTARDGGASLSATASNGTYNFGSGTTTLGGSDRAVGFLSSGSATASGNLYAQYVNDTGHGLASLNVAYDVEKYRGGSNPAGFRVQLFYSLDGTNWTTAGPTFATSFAADAANAGFATAPGVTTPVQNQLSVFVPNGAAIYLAWNYSVASGSTTTNAQALAIDNVNVSAGDTAAVTNPSGTGSASPNPVANGGSTLLTVNVTPGSNPASSSYTVTADLSSIGGSATQLFAAAGSNTFTYQTTVVAATVGAILLPVSITDDLSRSGVASISLTVKQPVPANPVKISQVYGGGGNAGALYQSDFVELFNPTDNPISLAGWSLQYTSATGSSWGSGTQPLGGTIAPHDYFLIALATGSGGTLPLPQAPITGDIMMSATAGKLALVSNSTALSGVCPLGDLDIVDFVGYGTAANCHEGNANTPAPSNTKAILRKNDGYTDTDNNGDDFVVGDPNPRGSGPAIELGPRVITTEPQKIDAPYDSSVSITFSEPVTVDSGWYNIVCGATSHNDASITHTDDQKIWVITPSAAFGFGDQCTVTLAHDKVHDVDTDDSAPNTDTLFQDYVFSFKVVQASEAAYPSLNLAMGNPSNATPTLSDANNYLLEKKAYVLSYNRDNATPNWVSWHLAQEWTGSYPRNDTFRPDPAIPADWYRVQAFDFFTTGYDRGHMSPNADRDNQNAVAINQETFLMSNMIPQAHGNNTGPWEKLESYLRTLLTDNELYVVSGPAGVLLDGEGKVKTLANGHVVIPAYTWKVALVLPRLSSTVAGDSGDPSRVTAATRTIAVIMPNDETVANDDWTKWKRTVDDVEALTHFDFFSNVRPLVQKSIEAGLDGANPPAVDDDVVNTAEDTPKIVSFHAVSATGTLTYHPSQPLHGTVTSIDGRPDEVSYAPAADYNGDDQFTVTVNDGVRDSAVATITIHVSEVNDPPVINPYAAQVEAGHVLTIPASTVIANDAAGPANESGQMLTLTSVSSTDDTHGNVVLSGGVITYTPVIPYAGPAKFAYQICDNGTTAGAPHAECAAGTVDVNVTDTTPPSISAITPSVSSLWPVDHKFVDVTFPYSFSDLGDANPSCSLSVSSNEKINGIGDGNTSPDWQVVDLHHVRLRAERSGTSTGRIYTITADCADHAFTPNHSQQSAIVTVPLSQK